MFTIESMAFIVMGTIFAGLAYMLKRSVAAYDSNQALTRKLVQENHDQTLVLNEKMQHTKELLTQLLLEAKLTNSRVTKLESSEDLICKALHISRDSR